MATAAGNLVVHLMAQTRQFEQGMKKSQQQTAMLRAGVGKLGSGLRMLSGAFLGVASVAGIGALIKSNLELLDQTGKLSDRLGVATEKLQGLRHAAEITGAGAAGMDRGLEMMNRRLGEAVRGTGEARRGLETLGLSAESLTAMSPDQAFYAIADAISKIESPAIRASVATDIFGRGAGDLINTLSLGASGLAEMQAEAERLGIAFDREAAAKAEAANDAITRLKSSIGGAAVAITSELAPAIETLAKKLADLPKKTQNAQAGILDMMADAAEWLGELPGGNVIAGAMIGGVLAPSGITDVGAYVDSMRDQAGRRRKGQATATGRVVPPAASAAAVAGSAGGLDADSGLAALRILAPRGGDGASAPIFSSDMMAGMEAVVARFERQMELSPVGEQLRKSLETPVEAFARRFTELEELAEFGAIDADTHVRALEKLRDEFGPEKEAEIAGPARFGGAMTAGSREAHSAILAAQGLGLDKPEKEVAKNTAKQIEMQAETNRRIGELIAQGEGAADIPPA